MHLWYVFATNLRFELWSWDKSSRKVPSTFLVFRTSLVRWCATQNFFGNWDSRVIVVFAPWDYEAHSEIVSEKVCPDLIFKKKLRMNMQDAITWPVMSGNPFGGPWDGNHDYGLIIKIVCSMMLLLLRITGEASYCLMKLISILKGIAK